jgi:hypothetical protein
LWNLESELLIAILQYCCLTEIYIPNSVPRISIHELDPLTFYRDFVSKNLPVIITDAIDHWPARQKWNHQYLRTVLADTHGSNFFFNCVSILISDLKKCSERQCDPDWIR